eukprot:Hpha_TRINITY_DN8628_c0_g1::TRINITY_DN8628_c0_g1_i1::g.168835::m.168835
MQAHATYLPLLMLLPAAAGVFRPSPYLNDLMVFENGTKVGSVADWRTRREELKNLLQDTIFGRLPPVPPQLTSASVVNSTTSKQGISSSFVELTYSCGVSTFIEILRPVSQPGDPQRLPVFMTQWNHREWAAIGASRGYLGVTYMGADILDSAPDFQRAYPDATMKLIIARAFVASRVLDYLLTLDYVDSARVSISGHSRNGKQSLIAAAFDERITAVVGSSPGAPIAAPYHFTSSNFFGEGPLTGVVAGKWWLLSILKYKEHPELLPVDGHAVVALIAPRKTAIASARTDQASDIRFAGEMGVREAVRAYQLYGKASSLRIFGRDGDHHGFNDIQTYFDWYDTAFGRRARKMAAAGLCTSCWVVAPEDLSTYTTAAGFSWPVWKSSYGDATPPAPPLSAPLRERVSWLLQLDTDTHAFCGGNDGGEEKKAPWVSGMMQHNTRFYLPTIKMESFTFGEGIDANIYYPANINMTTPQRALIWLHPYSYNT